MFRVTRATQKVPKKLLVQKDKMAKNLSQEGGGDFEQCNPVAKYIHLYLSQSVSIFRETKHANTKNTSHVIITQGS